MPFVVSGEGLHGDVLIHLAAPERGVVGFDLRDGSGLSVVAQLVEQEYPTGVKIADDEFASIALQPHQTLAASSPT